MGEEDILQIVADEDIPKLRELYKKNLPRGAYIYNYLESVAKWRTRCPEENYITLMAPHGNWERGTFVAIHEYACYEIFISTLEEDCEVLCEALVKTKKIKWNNNAILYTVHSDIAPSILKALDKTSFNFLCSIPCDVYYIPREKALKLEIECPPGVYIATLKESHAKIINSHWPHQYKDSDKYLATMIEMGGGCGVFLKDGTLVAWVLRNLLGLGALQTVDKYKRKGYGSLVTKALAKEIAKTGADPLGTVLENNIASQTMFTRLGFEALEKVVFIESQEMRS